MTRVKVILCGDCENAEFISKLSEYIRSAFDHEDEFVDFVSVQGKCLLQYEVDRFLYYERCLFYVRSSKLWVTGQQIQTDV